LEASALHPPRGLASPRLPVPVPLLRMRSDEQLVALFRAGSEDAFRVIHDRYWARLFAYTRQMLHRRQDAEDALQDVFVRAYRALRSSERDLVLRPWLYRVAHNRCVDELRRPAPPSAELLEVVRPPVADPLAEAERRDDLRRLVVDLHRLPEQQRSALLMRELDGLTYVDIAAVLDTSVPAIKSLLVRARMGLAQAGEAREAGCGEIRGQLAAARERGVRASGQTRRHLRDCAGCRAYRAELRSVERRLAAFAPGLGPLALVAKALGLGGAASGSSGTGGGAVCSTGAAAAGGAVCGSGTAAGGVAVVAAGKAVTVVAVAAIAAGGAVNIQSQLQRSRPHNVPARAPAVAPTARHAPAVAGRAVWPSAPAPAAKRAGHHVAAAPLTHPHAALGGAGRAAHKRPPLVTPATPTVTPAPATPVILPAAGATTAGTAPLADPAGSPATPPGGVPIDPTTLGTGADPAPSTTAPSTSNATSATQVDPTAAVASTAPAGTSAVTSPPESGG
jgi:RNA polymerase sigma factor (sigma-70 family)